jgi:APA family basic amino acid/polyamine antiporter
MSLPPTTLALGIAALLMGSILYILEDTPEGQLAVEEIRRLLNRPIDDAERIT